MLNFADALSNLRKKSRLMGKPVSQQEVAGVAEGYSREATGRLSTALQAKQAADALAQRKKEFEEQMLRDKEDREAAEEASKRESMMSGALGGAMIGAKAGGTTAGPWGAIIGAGAGAILGRSSSRCIIITACTSRDSHEVEISREFRDKYMSGYHLGGYYAIAHRIAPFLEKSNFLRSITKRFLVDRLIDFGEWVMEYKPEMRFRTSVIVTKGFLALCASIGKRIDVWPYIEAHKN